MPRCPAKSRPAWAAWGGSKRRRRIISPLWPKTRSARPLMRPWRIIFSAPVSCTAPLATPSTPSESRRKHGPAERGPSPWQDDLDDCVRRARGASDWRRRVVEPCPGVARGRRGGGAGSATVAGRGERRGCPSILRGLSRLSAPRDVSQGPLAHGNPQGIRFLPRLLFANAGPSAGERGAVLRKPGPAPTGAAEIRECVQPAAAALSTDRLSHERAAAVSGGDQRQPWRAVRQGEAQARHHRLRRPARTGAGVATVCDSRRLARAWKGCRPRSRRGGRSRRRRHQ